MFDGSQSQDPADVVRAALMCERALPHVPPPLWAPMDSAHLFGGSTGYLHIDIDALKQHLAAEGRLRPADALTIVHEATAMLTQEGNLLRLSEPIVVVGDIHGQFYDLIKLLELGGNPEKGTCYLFLGDYVDRGCFSCECVLLLFALKLTYPTQVYLLRGNHEARHLTTYFTFKTECVFKYGREFYTAVMSAFDALPLAAMVGRRYFCVHGGLSPDVTHIEEIEHIYRFREIPNSGAMCDLLWSDPHSDAESPSSPSGVFSGAGGYFATEPLFTVNDVRNCSYLFNFACLYHFISTNNILCVVRAHEAQDEGFRLYRSHPNTHFPSMLSLFSCPNYCDTYDNKGAIAVLGGASNISIKQFYSSAHPYILPNFMNGFAWSLPFVEDKLADAINTIMELLGTDDDDDDDEDSRGAGDTALPLGRTDSTGSSSGGTGVAARVRMLGALARHVGPHDGGSVAGTADAPPNGRRART